jgi:hypothetical protein
MSNIVTGRLLRGARVLARRTKLSLADELKGNERAVRLKSQMYRKGALRRGVACFAKRTSGVRPAKTGNLRPVRARARPENSTEYIFLVRHAISENISG